jgi:hypothetical protein
MNTPKLKICCLFVLVGFAIVAIAGDRTPVPIPSAPKEMTYQSLRGIIYCEVWLFKGTPETGVAGVYYNTSALNNSADKNNTCPANMWDKINVKSLESEYDVIAAFKNGPRGWTMDSLSLQVGPVVSFSGLRTRWMGQGEFPKGVNLTVPHMEAFKPLKSHRKSTMRFDKGKPVFVLEDAEGTPWVMQAFAQTVDPSLTYDSLKDLGNKLKLPVGWKYRVVKLDKDLTITTQGGFAWIIQDELQNTYDACKDGACNFKP